MAPDPYFPQQQQVPPPGPMGPGGPVAPDPELTRIKNRALTAMIVGFILGGFPGILGLVAYLKADTEPQTARTFTKWSWISLAIIWGLVVLVFVAYFAFVIIMLLTVFASAGAAG